MNKLFSHNSEPLIHVTKRDDVTLKKNIIIHLVGLAIAIIITSIFVLAFTGLNPVQLFAKVIDGAIGNKFANSGINKQYVVTLHKAAILLCLSLAVTPAFKMKFWNIGAEGQALIGCLMSAIVMIKLGGKMSEPALIILMAVSAVVMGMIWSVIPAICKAFWNTNETLFTVMMNYIAMTLISYFIIVTDKSGHNNLGIINEDSEAGFLPRLFGMDYLFNIFIILFVLVLMYVYLKYSKHGYEVSVVGESQNTARYIGINVKKVIIRTAALSGGLCGLVGFLIVAGEKHQLYTGMVESMGFTAVMVSWMSKFNPIIMAFVSLFITFLSIGTKTATSAFKTSNSVGDVIVAIVVFSIIAVEFFAQYKVSFKKKHNAQSVEANTQKGGEG